MAGNTDDKALDQVKSVFSRFDVDGYALNPHSTKWMRGFFDHLWAVFLGIILLIAAGAVIAFLQSEDRGAVTNRLRAAFEYPYFSYTRCYKYDLTTDADYVLFYPRTDADNCHFLLQTTPAGYTPLLEGRDNSTYTVIWNTIESILPICLVLLLSAVTFRDVTRKVPRFMVGLAKAGRLRIPSNWQEPASGTSETGEQRKSKLREWIRINFNVKPRGWNFFVEDFENALHSKWGLILSLLWLVPYIFLAREFTRTFDVFALDGFWLKFHYFMVLGVTGLVIVYLLGYVVWTLTMIAAYIRKLSPVFDLNIEPGHGDGCGGLKRLGDLCLEMALIIIYPMILIAIYILIGAVSASVREFQVSMGIGLVMAILLAALTFFWPLLDIHKDMLDTERRFQDEAATRIGKVEQQMRDLFGADVYDENAVKELEGRLEKLKKLYPTDLNYPTWPFTTKVVLVFYSSQIVPIITVVTGLVDFFGKFNSPSGS